MVLRFGGSAWFSAGAAFRLSGPSALWGVRFMFGASGSSGRRSRSRAYGLGLRASGFFGETSFKKGFGVSGLGFRVSRSLCR